MAMPPEPPKRQPVWCQLGTVGDSFIGPYTLVPGTDRSRLEQTLRLVDQRLQAEERALKEAERNADRADRKANTNRSRKNAPLFSTRRSMQGIRSSFSDLGSTLAEGQVQKRVREVERLYTLRYQIEDALARTHTPAPRELDVFDADWSPPVAGSRPMSSPQGRRSYCTSCGHFTEVGDSFCGNCGTKLNRI